MVNMVVISVELSIQQCLNYLSSMHSLSASDNGSWLFLNRFLCSTSSICKAFYTSTLLHVNAILFGAIKCMLVQDHFLPRTRYA